MLVPLLNRFLPLFYLLKIAFENIKKSCFFILLSVFSGLIQAGNEQSSSTQQSAHSQIKPLIESRCMVCHGCYDAPCQLKMESFEGLSRGANKSLVYDGARLTEAPLTRLYEDAPSLQAWRK